MRNRIIQVLGFLFIAFSSNAYSHTGTHDADWLQTAIHFISSPDHLPFIIPAMIILGLAVRSFVKAAVQRSNQNNDNGSYSAD